jgi:hypothetical protein
MTFLRQYTWRTPRLHEGGIRLKKAINTEYGTWPKEGYREKLLVAQYRKMFGAFLEFKGDAPNDTVLEVGAASTSLIQTLNYLPAWTNSYDRTQTTTFCDIDLPSHVGMHHYPAARRNRYEPTGGRRLPFDDGQFDWVYCNALIEHVGSFERQYELLKELTRVARKGVFVTAGNRWHPMEFNTGLPLLHWLPLAMWRRILKILGKRSWASESVLNPLGSSKLQELTNLLPGKLKSDIGHIRIFGIKAHFFLMIEKRVYR